MIRVVNEIGKILLQAKPSVSSSACNNEWLIWISP